MNKTVIMLTIILTFGFTSSGALAGSGFFVQGGGDGATPPDKPKSTATGSREIVVYGSGGGVTPPDKPKSLDPTSFCILGHCLKLN